MRPIAYASQSLHPAEKNYNSMKLKFLGMKWAITQTFREYLLDQKCMVWTANNPLSHLGTAILGATVQCWVAELTVFDYTVWYRPELSSKNADALFRQHPSQVDVTGIACPRTPVPQTVQGAVANAGAMTQHAISTAPECPPPFASNSDAWPCRKTGTPSCSTGATFSGNVSV